MILLHMASWTMVAGSENIRSATSTALRVGGRLQVMNLNLENPMSRVWVKSGPGNKATF